MDMKKFYERILNDETIADIPVTYVFRVVLSVFDIIGSGDCFYHNTME